MSQKSYAEHSSEEQKGLTLGVMNILDGWKLASDQIIFVLGLQDGAKSRHVNSYRSGNKAFPDVPELMERLDHIIGIADALRTTFPFHDSMRFLWMKKPHRRFQKNSPLSVLLSDESTNGLYKVRIEVDCAYGYQISEVMRDQLSAKASSSR